MLDELKRSGKSPAEFARERQISMTKLVRWEKRLGADVASRRAFVPVEIQPSADSAAAPLSVRVFLGGRFVAGNDGRLPAPRRCDVGESREEIAGAVLDADRAGLTSRRSRRTGTIGKLWRPRSARVRAQ